MLSDGGFAYAWDAENRLTSATPLNPVTGSKRLLFRYDWRHRLTQLTIQTHQSGAWAHHETRTLIYDGWLPELELVDRADGAHRTFEYFWGNDLSGTEQGAGGVGGLVAISVGGVYHLPCYDHNGNVTAYVSENGTPSAQYLYDAFGNTLEQSGPLADTFRHRFSTKCLIPETHSYYYGYRHYAPEVGEWLNRDPIGENGGLNLYSFAQNDAVNHIDYLGKLKKEFKKLAEKGMIFRDVLGSVEPGIVLSYECKCKKVEYDLFFHYTLRMLSKSDTVGWADPPKEHPGESIENWETWTTDQKYAFVRNHEEKHVYWWRVFFDAAVSILENQEAFKFSSDEACESNSEDVKNGILKAYDDYKIKQTTHYFWEDGH